MRGNDYSLVYDEWHERDVTDVVHRDRNHPSVVLWSCGNEIGDQRTPRGVELLRDLLNIFHREDPTRFVTVGCDQIAADPRGDAGGVFEPVGRGGLQSRRPLSGTQGAVLQRRQGRLHPDADNEITFEIQGPGKLIGVDNGDMSNQEDVKGKQKKAFHGMCLAIVQSTATTAGQVRVTATSPGLPPVTLSITTKA